MSSLTDLLGAEVLAVAWLDDLRHPQDNVDLDVRLGGEVARGLRPPLARVWRAAPEPGLAVSLRDLATAQAQAAADRLRGEGWLVVVRNTGGTAVPQGDGVLHFSLILPRTRRSGSTDAYYRLLTEVLIAWLAGYGVEAATGPLPGSYCDGQYNVVVGGRKLIGTAQSWRGGLAGMASGHPGYILAHACIMIDVDLVSGTRLINRFYAEAGLPDRVRAEASVCLRDLVPDDVLGAQAGSHGGAAFVPPVSARTPRWRADAAAAGLLAAAAAYFAARGIRTAAAAGAG
ncbi:hypothetical protein GCM10010885_17200 [Alicyclobacillus cellulosilyticus]|uniref:BPL/LPL catalytic domain-containing protein n=1 Tax=Alicyclobacillus cellulosilyticus TaxID=1003997 RepID=A0A917KFE4_9BACL|nr:hypothetical protein [Alicyclobacillus cellulosilyticus]GGJ08634.1 hypothetical protein GCM10010885_17200 [Alicyclobacillus cellulosilyticus]